MTSTHKILCLLTLIIIHDPAMYNKDWETKGIDFNQGWNHFKLNFILIYNIIMYWDSRVTFSAEACCLSIDHFCARCYCVHADNPWLSTWNCFHFRASSNFMLKLTFLFQSKTERYYFLLLNVSLYDIKNSKNNDNTGNLKILGNNQVLFSLKLKLFFSMFSINFEVRMFFQQFSRSFLYFLAIKL